MGSQADLDNVQIVTEPIIDVSSSLTPLDVQNLETNLTIEPSQEQHFIEDCILEDIISDDKIKSQLDSNENLDIIENVNDLSFTNFLSEPVVKDDPIVDEYIDKENVYSSSKNLNNSHEDIDLLNVVNCTLNNENIIPIGNKEKSENDDKLSNDVSVVDKKDSKSDNSILYNMKVQSEKDLTKNESNISLLSAANMEVVRRNSLPENKLSINAPLCDFTAEKDIDSISMSDLKIDNSAQLPNLKDQCAQPKIKGKQVEMKNMVKNMHGLFSLVGGGLKSAYKPVEKNLGGIMQATQKNLSAVKNDYLKSDKFNNKAAQNLSKYSTLNLLNDSGSGEEELFKKCDKFLITSSKINDSKMPDNSNINIKLVENKDQNLQIGNEKLLSIDQKNNENLSIDSCSENSLHATLNNYTSRLHSSEEMRHSSDTLNDEFTIGSNDLMHNDDNKSENVRDLKEAIRSDSENQSLSSDNLNEKTEILERAILEMRNELSVLKSALIQKDAIKKSLESRINLLMKQLENVTTERDASVVRYAVSERHILEATKSKDAAQLSEQAAKREVTAISQRLRTANAEKTRATAALDMKCHELSLAMRETGKVKEELQSCEVKLKWAQSKLVSEMEAHKETSTLVENLSFQIKQMEAGNFVLSSPPVQPSEIESQLREKDAIIILERHEKERIETRNKQLQSELDQLKIISYKSAEEVRELRAQVEAGAAESAALRRTCAELREQGAKDCERLAVAQARAARCDTLTVHLQQEQERSSKLVQELEDMKALRDEALAEGELKARREAELLRQAERLTAAGVKLQATCSEAEAKALALTVDNASLREAAAKAASELAEARLEITKEREGRAADARALASRAAQHARGEREALTALEAARGEARVLSTKHASAIKELKRELQQVKKKYDRLENERSSLPQSHTQLSSERTGSSSSLSSFEGHIQQNHNSETSDISQDIPANTPDRQQLVERIVSLQRAAARRGEKLEFMEEHIRQLTQELQKKTRLLRALLVSAPSGSLSSNASDAAKAEIGKHGGVMASVYGSQVTDETMTLELSLEINAKLQNLLEDTLLSNITLKENMDTLGDEITRLKENLKRSHK